MRFLLIAAAIAFAAPANASTWLLEVDGYIQVGGRTAFARHTIAVPMGSRADCEKALDRGLGARLANHLESELPYWRKTIDRSDLRLISQATCRHEKF